MDKLVKLTKNDIHVPDGFYDPDDDTDMFDIGYGGKYRVTWEFKTSGKSYYDYKTVSEGEKVVNSKNEAYKIFDMLKNKYEGTYATEFRIERLIKTLSDDRWENVYDASRMYVSMVTRLVSKD